MNAQLTHLMRLILSAIISLLGFSSCELFQEQGDMYGTPIADYQVKGCVTDADDNPIAGLRVVITETGFGEENDMQTLTTNKNGEYISEKKERKYRTNTLTITDIDGDENGGSFKEKTFNLNEIKPVLDKSKAEGWYEGVYVYTINTSLLREYRADE